MSDAYAEDGAGFYAGGGVGQFDVEINNVFDSKALWLTGAFRF